MTRRLRTLRTDERGMSLPEMLMGMFVFVIIFGAILTMVQGAMKNQDKIAKRVYATQKARPVLTGLVDALHSACVAPGIAPVLSGSSTTGSSSNQIVFYSKTGRAVSPIPDIRRVYLSGSTLWETVRTPTALSGTTPQTWAWGAESVPRKLVIGVSAGQVGSPSVSVPLFRYYRYVSGQVSTTPLGDPLNGGLLSATEAAQTVLIEIAFAVSPGSIPLSDPASRVTLTDSVTLRVEPASEDSAELNLPCA